MTKTLYDPLVEERGIERGKIELLLKLLNKKFNGLNSYYTENIMNSDEVTLDKISESIFDLKTINDLDQYLK